MLGDKPASDAISQRESCKGDLQEYHYGNPSLEGSYVRSTAVCNTVNTTLCLSLSNLLGSDFHKATRMTLLKFQLLPFQGLAPLSQTIYNASHLFSSPRSVLRFFEGSEGDCNAAQEGSASSCSTSC